MRLPESGVVHVGAGIQQQGDELASVRLGTLERTKAGSVWVASNQKRCAVRKRHDMRASAR